MTTVLNASEQRVLLRAVSWETYARIVAERGEDSGPRLTYDCGMLEIMVPSFRHETLKEAIAKLFELLAESMDMDYVSAGSTTFRREDLSKGFEPDACFYTHQASSIRGKDTIDLNIDPPPDLVIEIDVTRSSLDKLGIYAAVGVREIWRYTDGVLQILEFDGHGYVGRSTSSLLRTVTAEALTEHVRSHQQLPANEWVRQVREFAAKI